MLTPEIIRDVARLVYDTDEFRGLLADDLGVNKRTVQHWLEGTKTPPETVANDLATLLRGRLDSIVEGAPTLLQKLAA